MRPDSDVHEVFRLAADGLTQVEIAARVGVGQTTVSRWLRRGENAVLGTSQRLAARPCTDTCPRRDAAPAAPYAYLLGQYLGDGTLAHTGRGVYRLFICCCDDYPRILDETRRSIAAVMPDNAVGQRAKRGSVDLTCYSKHWPCLFPQHGPGHKHTRPITLEPWQRRIALEAHPGLFVRGLVHSDGCRTMNRVRNANGTTYAYARYLFSNRSADIRELFVEACHRVEVDTRPMGEFGVSVARRESVARLDAIIGPKR